MEYNLNVTHTVTKKNIRLNKKNKINVVEKSYYPHTRDLLALLIAKNSTKKILDFGSNIAVLSNLNNKIITKKKKFIIYDPFFKSGNKLKIKNIEYKIVNNLEEVYKTSFDLLHLGSCLQYIENYDLYLKMLKFNKNAKIFISATPININHDYITKQTNHNNLFQKVHSLKKIINFFNKKKFKLIFKSCMDINYAKLRFVKKHTYFMNLVLSK